MGKFRTRVKGTKGKRWGKNNSCVSNPQSSTFRNATQSNFFQQPAGKQSGSGLTVEALKHHDTFLGFTGKGGASHDATEEEMQDDSKTCKTFDTFASDWTNCTNPSFNRLLRSFRPDSAIKKEMLAVLAAVTEVIKAQGGQETETEYFGALMTALEVAVSEEDRKNSVAAILGLLAMGIKRVPDLVLRTKFPEASKTLMTILAKNQDNAVQAIGCLSVMLRAQEAGAWQEGSTLKVMDALLAFTIHTKPKIRKAAQHAIPAVLKGSRFMTGPTGHPAASKVAAFCIGKLEKSAITTASASTLHLLALIGQVMPTFPQTWIKKACETILKVITLDASGLVRSVAFRAIHQLAIATPDAADFPPEINSQLINALYDVQPASCNDARLAMSWLDAVSSCVENLARNDVSLAGRHLPRFFSTAMDWLQVLDHQDVLVALVTTMASLLKCAAHGDQTAASKVLETLHIGLKYQYHSVWKHVLCVIALYFEAASVPDSTILPCLKTMSELRDSYRFPHQPELDGAIGAAIRAYGPATILKAVPLEITGEEETYEFPRGWLLPIMRDYVSHTQLSYFTQRLVPLATLCHKRATELQEHGSKVGYEAYDLLQRQIWSCLPGFCDKPTDLATSLQGIARTLGQALTDRPDIRLDVLAGIRNLVSSGNVSEVARFAKNYLPLLFNIYTTQGEAEGHRRAVLETIKSYLKVSPNQLTTQVFSAAMSKLQAEPEEFVRNALFDLVRCLLPYQDSESLREVYKLIVPQLDSKERSQQKKAYRLLEEICRGESDSTKQFLNDNVVELKMVLLNSLSSSAPTSKGPRLQCVLHLVRHLDEDNEDIVPVVVPEAILCCRDVNERTRRAAYEVLVELGHTLHRWAGGGNDTAGESLRKYLQVVLAGLAGSPTLVSATLLALSTLLFQFRKSLPSDVLQLLVDNTCLLMTSRSREIVGCTLSFIKVFLSGATADINLPFVPQVVTGLSEMSEDCKRHFRIKMRDLFSLLVRKFGSETVDKLIPKSDFVLQKRLKNVRKSESRRKKLRKERKRKGEEEEEDDNEESMPPRGEGLDAVLEDSDSEAEGKEVSAKGKSYKKSAAWIQEGADEIVDFLEPSTSQKIATSKPSIKRKAADANRGFKEAEDGRLVIHDDEDEEKDGRSCRSSDLDIGEQASRIGGKRKRSMDENNEPPNKYQAGGKGIHRPIHQKPKKPQKTTPGAEYKNPKASGDRKIKGKPDPFAYVPMQREALNRRKKAKFKGQFKGLVKAAKKGAARGAAKGASKKAKGKKRR